MNKLEKLEEQYKKLGEEIQALKKEKEFVPGWYVYYDNQDGPYVIDFVEDEQLYELKEDTWKHIEPATQELLNRFLPKLKTKYDWSKFPDWATIAVMNSDGSICCGDHKSAISTTSGWRGKGHCIRGWSFDNGGFVSYIDKSQWKDSFEKRPK